MMWTIRLTKKSAKALKTFDNSAKNNIERFIDKLIESDNPRSAGKARHCKEALRAYGAIGLEIIV